MRLELPDNLSDEAVWGIFCSIMQDASCSESVQPLDRIAVAPTQNELKVLLIRYPRPGYLTPARSKVLGAIRWEHVT